MIGTGSFFFMSVLAICHDNILFSSGLSLLLFIFLSVTFYASMLLLVSTFNLESISSLQ